MAHHCHEGAITANSPLSRPCGATFPLGGKAKKLKNVRFLVKTPLPNFLRNDIILKR